SVGHLPERPYRCPHAPASAHLFQTAASCSEGFQRSPRRATTSWTQAASPQGHTTWSASASCGKDGKGCRRACKKTRWACLLGSKVVSVPIQYTPASALATLRSASALA